MEINTTSSDRPLLVGVGEILWDLLPNGRKLGGAPANVVCHGRQFGLRCAMFSAVGDDELGKEALSQLQQRELQVDSVQIDKTHPTGTAGVQLDNAGKSNFTITENVAWDYLHMSPTSSLLAQTADAVVVGTLAQRAPVSRTAIHAFLSAAKPNCLVVFDINLRQNYYDKESLLSTIAKSKIVKVSDDEWPAVALLLNLPVDPVAGATALQSDYNLQLVALTRGGAGSVLISNDDVLTNHGIQATVADTIGAGDSFTATMITGLLRNVPLNRIQDAASHVAAYVCSQHGATPQLPENLRALL